MATGGVRPGESGAFFGVGMVGRSPLSLLLVRRGVFVECRRPRYPEQRGRRGKRTGGEEWFSGDGI
jgi:hypothetical protein